MASIQALYLEVDRVLEDKRAIANAAVSRQIEAKQVLNDQAYFLLCWGQLEVEIDETCRKAIRKRRIDPDWQVRRSWYLYDPDDKRLSGLSFEDRARLVLDAQEKRKSPFARTMAHYEMRNRVAHGKLEAQRIDVPAIVAEFYVIQSALHRAA